MKNKETFDDLFQILKSSQNEDEVVSNLKSILKHCSIDEYKQVILDNPYFKSVLPDVRDSVCNDIDLIRNALDKEIKEIDSELGKIVNQDKFSEQIQKLKELKRDCISLIYEIDERKKDLNSLI